MIDDPWCACGHEQIDHMRFADGRLGPCIAILTEELVVDGEVMVDSGPCPCDRWRPMPSLESIVRRRSLLGRLRALWARWRAARG